MVGVHKVQLLSLRNDFIASTPVYLQLTFEILPLSSYALRPTMLPLMEIFWNSCCETAFSSVTFFGYLQYPEIFVPLSRLNFWEQSEVM